MSCVQITTIKPQNKKKEKKGDENQLDNKVVEVDHNLWAKNSIATFLFFLLVYKTKLNEKKKNQTNKTKQTNAH